MRFLWQIILKGLAAVLPVGITFYLIYSIGVSVEQLMRPIILSVLPAQYYWPGMGWLVGLAALFCIGLVVNAWMIRHLFRFGEQMLERIPLVKSVYGALRDFTGYFLSKKGEGDVRKVVWIDIGGVKLIGFITRENLHEIPGLGSSVEGEDLIAVYIPQSYQVSGFTVYVPRASVTEINMKAEDAMRLVLTAGVSTRPVKIEKPVA
ncbi:hypothetical protein TDB9533_03405 [Thalassocella blandensis]|nr:hypothetical protein TDB9533_03405 [Thalassocella blandensis]